MSLKGFHVVFILSAIILLIGFAYWAFNQYAYDHQLQNALTMAASLFTAVVLAIYEINFIKKVKD